MLVAPIMVSGLNAVSYTHLPTTSSSVFGRYLSVHNISIPYKNWVKRASSWILGFAPSLILKSQSAIASIKSI